jgi:hypothetical protein
MPQRTVFHLAFICCLISGLMPLTALADEAPITAPSKKGAGREETVPVNPSATEGRQAGERPHIGEELTKPREPLTQPREPLTQPREPLTQPREPLTQPREPRK